MLLWCSVRQRNFHFSYSRYLSSSSHKIFLFKAKDIFLEQCLYGDRSFVFIFKENATDRTGENLEKNVQNTVREYYVWIWNSDKNHTTLKRLTARIDYSLNQFHLSLCVFLLFTPHLEAKMFNSQFSRDNFATDKFSLHVWHVITDLFILPLEHWKVY